MPAGYTTRKRLTASPPRPHTTQSAETPQARLTVRIYGLNENPTRAGPGKGQEIQVDAEFMPGRQPVLDTATSLPSTGARPGSGPGKSWGVVTQMPVTHSKEGVFMVASTRRTSRHSKFADPVATTLRTRWAGPTAHSGRSTAAPSTSRRRVNTVRTYTSGRTPPRHTSLAPPRV